MKARNKIICLTAVLMTGLLFLANAVFASEPGRPRVNASFKHENEAKINRVAKMSPEEAFESLKDISFSLDENLLHKAIYKTFRHRAANAISLALQTLSLPEREEINGELVDRTNDYYVAKNILEVFPKKAAPKLAMLYERADPITKGNIIRACGNVAGGKTIRNLLLNALDDKTVCENEQPEMVGDPMRICDVAYNQLVLRYDVKDVLRVIGNSDRVNVRDFHIDVLKNALMTSR